MANRSLLLQQQQPAFTSLAAGTLIALLGAIAVFQVATVRPGVPLGSDAAMYLLHARNIVEGRPYAETGYVVNPLRRDHSPVTYPPVTAALLAPVYAFAGLDLKAYKVEASLILVLACLAVYLALRKRAGHWTALVVTAGIGFLPLATRLKNDILSDVPFLLFLYVAIWYAERQLTTAATPGERLRRGLIAGALVFLAAATRSLGVFVIPALLLAEWLRDHRRLPILGLAAAVTCGVLLLAQEALLADTASYLDMPAVTAERMRFQMGGYLRSFRDTWYGEVPVPLGRWPAFGLIAALSLAGWLVRMRRPGPGELFVPIYLAVIALAPVFAGPRYLLPILPLQAVWACEGVGVLSKFGGAHRRAVALALALILAMPIAYGFMVTHRWGDKGPVGTGYSAPPVVEVMGFLAAKTAPDEVILSHMPRTVALLTGRRSVIHHRLRVPDSVHWALIDSLGIRMLLLEPAEAPSVRVLRPFIERNRDRFEQMFGNEEFEVWQIARPIRQP